MGKSDYLLLILNGYLTGPCENCCNLPSWSASNSAKFKNEINPTITAFILILPHLPTSYDLIFTSMLNFPNIMKQEIHAVHYGAVKVCIT